MKWSEISEALPADPRFGSRDAGGPPIPPRALAKAQADGFDTSQIWFHGGLKAIKTFRQPKYATELGKGIYLADSWNRAYSWALSDGHVMSCCVRKGEFLDLSALDNPKTFRELRQRHSAFMNTKWGSTGLESAANFKERMARILRYTDERNDWFKRIGYVGAYDHNSQIIGQIVVFDATDVRVLGVAPGSGDFRGKDGKITPRAD